MLGSRLRNRKPSPLFSSSSFLMIRLFLLCEMSAIFQLNFAKDDTFINFSFCVIVGVNLSPLKPKTSFLFKSFGDVFFEQKRKKKQEKTDVRYKKNQMSKNRRINFLKPKKDEFPRPFPEIMPIMGCVTVNAKLRQA